MSKEKPASAAVKKSRSEPGPTEAIIYLGPPLPKVATYSVFKDGVPKYMEKDLERIPAMRSLFLPVSEFTKRRGELNEVGSPLYAAYQAVLAEQEGSV